MSSSKGSNRYANELSQLDLKHSLQHARKVLRTGTLGIVEELVYGFKAGTIPWALCFIAGTVNIVIVARHCDRWLLTEGHFGFLYPTQPALFWSYRVFWVTSPWIAWAFYQLGLRRKLLDRLKETFINAGLKTPMDRLPNFISDYAIDQETRKLKLYAAGIPLDRFNGAKRTIESSLQIYIDEIREQRAKGTVEVIYSHSPMPETILLEKTSGFGPWKFLVGQTRSEEVRVDLRKVPHLLVAGQTGGGKSTFLRQFITTLYLNNKSAKFLLIDLKGGLEFQLFEGLKRTEVMPDIKEAMHSLAALEEELEHRMKLLKEAKCKDLEAYYAHLKSEQKDDIKPAEKLSRHIIVIDEAAEMFLAGTHASASEIQNSKKVLSKIARQGRSVGVHLIVATQRPDTKALDPQVKANLTGVLCFQMQNDASSMTVLGNGRATDLAPVPGRAIWKVGGGMIEIQTPFLGASSADEMLKPEREGEAK
jgi:energy-coupling factor transporter ATP-binding protein EcfA2